jgi:hypothetical protein
MSQEKCEVCGVELHWSPLVEGLPQMSTVSDCRHVVQLPEPSMTPIPPIPEDLREMYENAVKYLGLGPNGLHVREYTRVKMFIERIAKLTAELSDEEREHERTIIQRDAAEEALSDAYLSVTDHEAIWSNLFGYREALNGICEEVHSLRAENTRLKAPVSDEVR